MKNVIFNCRTKEQARAVNELLVAFGRDSFGSWVYESAGPVAIRMDLDSNDRGHHSNLDYYYSVQALAYHHPIIGYIGGLKPDLKVGGYDVEISAEKVKVGCQDVSWETIEEIMKRRPKQ